VHLSLKRTSAGEDEHSIQFFIEIIIPDIRTNGILGPFMLKLLTILVSPDAMVTV
jgi:hypothetical protein